MPIIGAHLFAARDSRIREGGTWRDEWRLVGYLRVSSVALDSREFLRQLVAMIDAGGLVTC